ncbi:NUMOD3 domain-containing DNA-binding protein [Halobacteria archaeon AArc-dxtr1]|nr:NUMOD3 domain-containing DNA-binding protein [Halobacteria archaeon AArc-dxtr1]
MYGRTGEDHPLYGYTWSDEQRQKLSDALRGTVPGKTKPRQVIKSRHVVRNGWEAAIDLILHDSPFEYSYEDVSFQLSGQSYTPDFVAAGVVIEVKGMVWSGDDDKAKTFMELYDRPYVVVGSELPCDEHLPWDEREQLPGVIEALR